MSLISFFKDAGEKLFGHKPAEAAAAAPDDAALQAQSDAANQTAATAIASYIATQNLTVDGLDVGFDGATGTVSVAGEAADQATKEKVILCCGNVHGVSQVDDAMTVREPAEESSYYTVVRGDTLSAIAKAQYGNANGYMKIFEANKPMLSNPDKIYPGQLLRIPPA
ncbi:MAG: peptidoglycan-binding protein LysM [Rhizobacter sp.]|nr:peptidoglycan-binding protein LysM [Rhizobacter sp.]